MGMNLKDDPRDFWDNVPDEIKRPKRVSKPHEHTTEELVEAEKRALRED